MCMFVFVCNMCCVGVVVVVCVYVMLIINVFESCVMMLL